MVGLSVPDSVSERPSSQPTDPDRVSQPAHGAVEHAVLAHSVTPGPVRHRRLNHRAPLHPDKRGEETVHAVEPRQAEHRLTPHHLERASRIPNLVAGNPVAQRVRAHGLHPFPRGIRSTHPGKPGGPERTRRSLADQVDSVTRAPLLAFPMIPSLRVVAAVGLMFAATVEPSPAQLPHLMPPGSPWLDVNYPKVFWTPREGLTGGAYLAFIRQLAFADAELPP